MSDNPLAETLSAIACTLRTRLCSRHDNFLVIAFAKNSQGKRQAVYVRNDGKPTHTSLTPRQIVCKTLSHAEQKATFRLVPLALRIDDQLLGVAHIYFLGPHTDTLPSCAELDELAEFAGLAICRALREEQLLSLLMVDLKTGAHSYFWLMDDLERQKARADRTCSVYSVVVFDLNKFKRLNKQLGHVFCDRLLKALVTRIQTRLRKSEALARWGGDEFVIILPETSPADAIQFARLLQADLAAQSLLVPSSESDPSSTPQPVPVSISVGVATYPLDAHDIPGLLTCAFARMQQDKRRSKNQ